MVVLSVLQVQLKHCFVLSLFIMVWESFIVATSSSSSTETRKCLSIRNSSGSPQTHSIAERESLETTHGQCGVAIAVCNIFFSQRVYNQKWERFVLSVLFYWQNGEFTLIFCWFFRGRTTPAATQLLRLTRTASRRSETILPSLWRE